MVLSFELFNFGFSGFVNYIRISDLWRLVESVMEGEKMIEDRGFLAAPLTFFVVVVFQLLSKWLDQLKKKGSKNTRESELRSEIKQLLREASALSQPATFAQAAKLRRSAATKEKELAQYMEQHNKEVKLSYDLYGKVLLASKVVVYLILVFWFWRTPIAIIAKQLVQPFGTLLSWGIGGHLTGHVLVGIIPWLILSTRVSKYVCRFVEF